MKPLPTLRSKLCTKLGGVSSGDYGTVIIVSRYNTTKDLDHALLGTPEVILNPEQ